MINRCLLVLRFHLAPVVHDFTTDRFIVSLVCVLTECVKINQSGGIPESVIRERHFFNNEHRRCLTSLPSLFSFFSALNILCSRASI